MHEGRDRRSERSFRPLRACFGLGGIPGFGWTMSDKNADTTTSVDSQEVEKFQALAGQWWDPDGKFRPLHRINPVRLAFIRDNIVRHFERDPAAPLPFADLAIVDVGCGGGILTEPLARLGARVTGIDPSPTTVEVARAHAGQSGLDIDYRDTTAEALHADGDAFDIVIAMEVVEHVNDMPAFIETCAALTKPGGLVFLSTINRTLKAYALAIVGAEYILRWLEPGTHDFAKLVRPAELEAALRASGLATVERAGVRFNPLSDTWSRSTDLDVNYMLAAAKPAA